MPLPRHNVWICGSLARKLARREKNLEKGNKKGSLVIFRGNLVCLLVTRLW